MQSGVGSSRNSSIPAHGERLQLQTHCSEQADPPVPHLIIAHTGSHQSHCHCPTTDTLQTWWTPACPRSVTGHSLQYLARWHGYIASDCGPAMTKQGLKVLWFILCVQKCKGKWKHFAPKRFCAVIQLLCKSFRPKTVNFVCNLQTRAASPEKGYN